LKRGKKKPGKSKNPAKGGGKDEHELPEGRLHQPRAGTGPRMWPKIKDRKKKEGGGM